MGTTVELPPELMRAAKARAAETGESLKTLLTRAVAAELHAQPEDTGRSTKVRLPLFGSAGRKVTLTNADLERALADADATPTHTARRPRKAASR
jgi:hypothetical protein